MKKVYVVFLDFGSWQMVTEICCSFDVALEHSKASCYDFYRDLVSIEERSVCNE